MHTRGTYTFQMRTLSNYTQGWQHLGRKTGRSGIRPPRDRQTALKRGNHHLGLTVVWYDLRTRV